MIFNNEINRQKFNAFFIFVVILHNVTFDEKKVKIELFEGK